MPLLTLNLGCENVKYPAQKHFEKINKLVHEESYLGFYMSIDCTDEEAFVKERKESASVAGDSHKQVRVPPALTIVRS